MPNTPRHNNRDFSNFAEDTGDLEDLTINFGYLAGALNARWIMLPDLDSV